MAIVMLIGLFVQHERSFDLTQPNVTKHFRLVMHAQENNNEYILTTPRAAKRLNEIAGIEDVFYLFKTLMVSDDKVVVGNNALQLSANYAATANITNFVNIKILAGSLYSALNEPDKIALSRSEALRLFGNHSQLQSLQGRKLQLKHNNQILTVTAIFEDLPINSHFYFRSLVSFSPYENIRGNVAHTYVAVSPEANTEQLAEKITEIFQQIWQWQGVSYRLQAIRDIHLGNNYAQDMKVGGALSSVMISVVMAILLLLISCVNYVNFSIAQASQRAKEIGIRKALGASRLQLFSQFMTEAMLLALLAIVGACVLVELALPHFVELLGRPLPFTGWQSMLWQILGLSLLVGVASGVYPSLYLSRSNTKAILSGKLQRGRAATWLRKSLLSVQVVLSIGLLIGSLTITKQLRFLQSLPVNYGKSTQWVIEDMPASIITEPRHRNMLDILKQQEGIQAAVALDFSITQSTNAGIFIDDPSTPNKPFSLSLAGVSGNVVEALELQLLVGRDFSIAHTSDWYSAKNNQALLYQSRYCLYLVTKTQKVHFPNKLPLQLDLCLGQLGPSLA
ncbi:ABC transporter permease [Pseudoalteromonas sp. T1lg65]|uniref:ABC transporter permease n=1 Tax=Pseudoalteromonas sp. T1lg65 TaxID=2077101 RepID=UPI003F794440